MSDKRHDEAREPDPHHVLNNPDGAPFGEDAHVPTRSRSTSQPHPEDDIKAPYVEGPKRDKLPD